jgi:small subunit ribosomal protein S2
MSKYLFGVRNGLSIIDLQKTGTLLQESLKIVKQVAKNNGRILFVATKKQASDTIATTAKKCGQYYVNHRWLGGMLTNWKTVSKSIKTLADINDQLANDELGLNKKEKLVLSRKQEKLEATLGGIKDMGGYPDLVFVIDTHRESLAILEAKRIGIPVMAILDSNCRPDNVTYPIPGNDDSIKSIKLYCHLISEAVLAGIRENMSAAGVVNTANAIDTKVVVKKTEAKAAPKAEVAVEAKKEAPTEKVAVKAAAPKKEVVKKSVAPKAAATKAAAPKKAAVKKPVAPKKAPAKK